MQRPSDIPLTYEPHFYDCVEVLIVAYIYDLLVFRKDVDSHLEHMNTGLSRLNNHQRYVSPKMCEFLKSEFSFLGMIVEKGGIKANPRKIEVPRKWPRH